MYNNWKSLQLAREKSIGEYILSFDRSNVKLSPGDSLQLVFRKPLPRRVAVPNLRLNSGKKNSRVDYTSQQGYQAGDSSQSNRVSLHHADKH